MTNVCRQIERATTLSVSLGPSMSEVLLPLLASVEAKPDGQRPALYACESDHDAIDRLGESLRGKRRAS